MTYDVEESKRRRREQEEAALQRAKDFELRAELNEAWDIWKHLCPADFDPDCGPDSPVREEYWPAIAGHMVTWMAEFRTRGLLGRLDYLESFEISPERREAINVYRMAAERDAQTLAKHLRAIGYEWDRDFWPEFKDQWRAFVPRDLIDPPPLPEPEADAETTVQTSKTRGGDIPTDADLILGREVLARMATKKPSSRAFREAFRATGARASNEKLNRLLPILISESQQKE